MHPAQGGGDGIGDLVLHHLRRLTGIARLDDDLDVRQVRDGVQRDVAQGIEPPRHDQRGDDQDQKAVVNRPANDPRDHGMRPPGRGLGAGWLAAQAHEPGLEIGLGVEQELGGNHDPVALLQPGADHDLVLAQVLDLHRPRLEAPAVQREDHPRALAGDDHRLPRDQQHIRHGVHRQR